MARSIVSFSIAAMLVVCSLASKPTAAMANAFDYRQALEKSLLFFEAQRSGKLPPDQRVKWRGDSGLKDGFDQGVDLVGGYYDAGDHVKFGLPMAFAVTMLSWGTIEFEKEIAAANQLEYALDAIRWGTDYFMKAHKQPDTFWAQVGDGDSDHYCWTRAEDMATPRTAYNVDSDRPGSDVAAETAAAMAAASIAFKPYNSSYSKLLLLHAKQLFAFADTFRGRYDDSIDAVRKYYPSSSGYHDELLWAASWLFEATDDQYYLKYVADNAVSLGGTGWAVREFSWDNKYAGVQVLLTKVLMEGGSEAYSSTLKQYQAKAEYFLCACLQKNMDYNVEMTPGGLLYFDEWNNMQYVVTASFLLAVYSDLLSMKHAKLECPDGQVQPSELLKFAQSQADYILGKNPKSMSYLVGYQWNYPTHVHHRGASMPSIFVLPSPIGCIEGFDKWYHRQEGNPNAIVGALLGGPDRQDQFYDDRSKYEQTEPTVVGNAPLIGLFARLAGEPGYSGYLPRYSTAAPSEATAEVPFEFLHTITNSWKEKGVNYYRHRVTVKNTGSKPIAGLKLHIENLSGPLWGLSPTTEKNIYELPPWLQVVKPGTPFDFVYIQEGPQAKVSVVSYH
ncbi:endoglucanase 13 isoform X1 [Phoenix dactylifera]|uniref:Endoglucanase n=1 Tax=Phoenix dactylifera TaxID=42345 RepID=A0A8B8ZI88_PHODC|nr:endoglucanase 13 isoform X1 [Phoenix dactylifera]